MHQSSAKGVGVQVMDSRDRRSWRLLGALNDGPEDPEDEEEEEEG